MTNKIDLTGFKIVDFKVSRKAKKSFRTSGWEKADGISHLSSNLLDNDFNVPARSIGLLFSGGYDSTALMIYYLEKGFTVLPISFLFNGVLVDWITPTHLLFSSTMQTSSKYFKKS